MLNCLKIIEAKPDPHLFFYATNFCKIVLTKYYNGIPR